MKKGLLALLALVVIQPAFAANIWCGGKVTNAYIDSSKNVIIKGTWRNDYTRICSTDGSNGVDTVSCSLWFSIISTSMVHDKDVLLMYSDNGGTMTCANIPSYANAPGPQYVMLQK
jgi:hypothetical protein